MAEWMPVREDLWTDPRILRMTDLLGADCLPGTGCALTSDDVTSKFLRAQAWARAHTATGTIRGASARTLDLVLRCDGFARAMEAVGWLEVGETYLRFPSWDTWNSQGAKARLYAARRQARKRSADRHAESVTPVTRASRAPRNNNRGQNNRGQDTVVVVQNNELQKRLCSLLLAITDGPNGRRVFDPAAAAAIARDGRCTEIRIRWAIDEIRRQAMRPRNPAGWLRKMVLDERIQPPSGWVESYNRERLARASAAAESQPVPPAHKETEPAAVAGERA